MIEKSKYYFNNYIYYLTLQNRSIKNIKYSLKIYFNYLDDNDIDITRIKISDAQNFQTYLVTMTDSRGNIKYTKGSVGAIIGSITGFYDFLKREKVIYSNPFYEIKKLKTPKTLPKNIPDEETMNKLLKYLRDFNKGKNLIERKSLYKAHVLAEVLYSCGLRINEAGKIKTGDVDLVRGIVTIKDSKSNHVREAILNEYCQKVLRIYIDSMREKVLFGKNNGDLSLLFGSKTNLKTWLNTLLRKKKKALKIDRITSHYFRHAVGCHLLRAGCDIRYIQEILGHKKITSTQVYTKIEKEDLRNVLDKFHPRSLRKGT